MKITTTTPFVSHSLLCLLLLLISFGIAQAQSTQFSYQGRLTDNSLSANGAYDFQFKLFDAASGGAQVGATVSLTNINVSSGIFTVTLDFGASAFPGANRFLEINVRLAGGGAFTTLNPRQPVTSTPYAIQSLNAANAANAANATNATTATNFSGSLSGDVTGTQAATALASNAVTTPKIADANVTDAKIASVSGGKITGTIPVAGVPAGSGNYIQNGTTQQASSNFNISGNGVIGGNVGIKTGATAPATALDVNGIISLKDGNTRLLFSGLNTESGAQLINIGVNNTRFGGFDATKQGGYFRVDTRNGTPLFQFRNSIGEALLFSIEPDGTLFGNGAGLTNLNAGNLATGTLAIARGGTGMTAAPTAAGQFLRSTGANTWAVGSLAASDLPSGSTNYIQNGTALQASSNFNISGNGIIGGNLGIGTAAPNGPLHVVYNGNTLINAPIITGAADNVSFKLANTSTNGKTWVFDSTAGSSGFGQGNLAIFPATPDFAATPTMTLQANGNVGIGTLNPGSLLTLRANSTTATALEINRGAIQVAGAGIGTSTPVFIHQTTAANTNVVGSYINNPLTNGNPNAMLIVTLNQSPGGVSGNTNSRVVGVLYDPTPNQWVIFNVDGAAMPQNVHYNVLVVKP